MDGHRDWGFSHMVSGNALKNTTRDNIKKYIYFIARQFRVMVSHALK